MFVDLLESGLMLDLAQVGHHQVADKEPCVNTGVSDYNERSKEEVKDEIHELVGPAYSV